MRKILKLNSHAMISVRAHVLQRACSAQKTTSGLVRLMTMTSEFLVRDDGEGGPNLRNLDVSVVSGNFSDGV